MQLFGDKFTDFNFVFKSYFLTRFNRIRINNNLLRLFKYLRLSE